MNLSPRPTPHQGQDMEIEMKSKLILTALASFAGFIAVPAQADNFDGPYIGVQACWNRAEVTDRTIDAQPIDAEASREAFELDGEAG